MREPVREPTRTLNWVASGTRPWACATASLIAGSMIGHDAIGRCTLGRCRMNPMRPSTTVKRPWLR